MILRRRRVRSYSPPEADPPAAEVIGLLGCYEGGFVKDALCVILGGGRGTRLFPLTKYRAKPAVPLVGKYRLIDIPISNCLNSGFNRIVILTQFNSASLNRHISQAYKLDSFSQGSVEIIAADQAMDHGDWFQGSADAVRKCLPHFGDPRIKYLLILSGDQLYTMDFRKLLQFHIERKAEITVACNPVDQEDTRDLGIADVGVDFRIRQFIEKPKDQDLGHLAVEVEGKKRFLASMGIYVFNKDALAGLLLGSKAVDFGREIIPGAIGSKVTYAFVHPGYWKDIGNIAAFYKENLAFTAATPPIDLFDENWQFFTRPRYLPLSRFSSTQVENSVVSEGALIDASRIVHSIIGLRSVIAAGSLIEDSVIMGNDYYDSPATAAAYPGMPAMGIGRNCRIKNAIVDKNARIGDHVIITNDAHRGDSENEYCVIRGGVIIIPKGTVIPSGTVI